MQVSHLALTELWPCLLLGQGKLLKRPALERLVESVVALVREKSLEVSWPASVSLRLAPTWEVCVTRKDFSSPVEILIVFVLAKDPLACLQGCRPWKRSERVVPYLRGPLLLVQALRRKTPVVVSFLVMQTR